MYQAKHTLGDLSSNSGSGSDLIFDPEQVLTLSVCLFPHIYLTQSQEMCHGCSENEALYKYYYY